MYRFLKMFTLPIFLLFIVDANLHASRIWGAIADEGYYLSINSNPDDDNFTRTSYELNNLNRGFRGQGDNDHPNGWGMVYYADAGIPSEPRFIDKHNSSEMASTDPDYTTASGEILGSLFNTTTVLAHVRKTSSGAGDIPNPHPWIMVRDGITFTFAHNGTIHDKYGLRNLIGDSWIDSFGGLNTFGNGDWHDYESSGWAAVVDSELYFFWLMKNIVLQGKNIFKGLHQALSDPHFDDIATWNYEDEHLNFVFTDGDAIWAYRRAGVEAYPNIPDKVHTLYYCISNYDNNGQQYHMKTVASQQTHYEALGEWVALDNYDLAYLPREGNIEIYDYFPQQPAVDTKPLTSSWNWVGFPVLDNIEGTLISEVFENLAPNALTLKSKDEVVSYFGGVWDDELNMDSKAGYKLEMSEIQDVYSLRIAGELIQPDDPITLQPGENWVSYFLDETQHPFEVLEQDVKDRLTSIRGQHWYIYKFKGQWYQAQPSGCDGPDPDESCILFRYGSMYELTLSSGEDITLQWQPTQEPPRGKSITTTSFQVNELADYSALVVETVEDPETVTEIGIFIDDNCIGAEPVNEFPVYVKAYNGDQPLDGVTFQIVREPGLAKGINNSEAGHQRGNVILEHYRLNHLDHEIVDAGFPVYHADLEKGPEPMITESSLIACYPNPFNPSTTLRYELAKDAPVSVVVYNMQGRVVENLYQGSQSRGQHELTWNASSNESGLYFVVFKTSDFQSTQKVMLLK